MYWNFNLKIVDRVNKDKVWVEETFRANDRRDWARIQDMLEEAISDYPAFGHDVQITVEYLEDPETVFFD